MTLPHDSGSIRRKWLRNRACTLLEIHQAHYANYGVDLPLHEEEYPDDVDRVLAWRASRAAFPSPLRSVPLWMTGCAATPPGPRKKTFEDLVAEVEATGNERPDTAASRERQNDGC